MKIRIEEFQEKYIEPVGKLLRQCLFPDSFPDTVLIEKTFRDPNFSGSPSYVVFLDESPGPIAFIQSVIRRKKEGHTGYIKLIATAPSYRRNRVASYLLRQVEAVMKEQGVTKLRAFDSFPNFYFPGIEYNRNDLTSFFEHHLFKKAGDVCLYEIDLSRQSLNTEIEEEIILRDKAYVRRVESDEEEAFIEWLSEFFPDPYYSVLSAFDNSPISLHLLISNQELWGFGASEVNNKGTGSFGPIAIRPEKAGFGFEKVLIKKCLQDLRNIGFIKAIILQPLDDPGRSELLRMQNVVIKKVFWQYEKEL